MQALINHIKEALKPYYPETEISGFMRIIIEYATDRPYSLALIEKAEITPEQKAKADTIIEQLKTYKPIQYIVGETEFFGLPFSVNEATLIPRPETEELVELIIDENTKPNLHILDIGTGSGCIAIALAKYMKGANTSAWDFSEEALAVAKQNAQRNKAHIAFSAIDVLAGYPTDKKFDIIVSNPPYVLESEKDTMEQNVLNYEPHSALFVPDNNALLFYERIADIALAILNPEGKLYFEINQAKGEETLKMLGKKGFINLSLFKDLSKRDRMIRAQLNR